MPDEQQMVKVVINGQEVESAQGRLLIDVAEEHNVFVPRFCYHPGLESVAACRMCLVEIEGSRRPLDPACVTPVADGMVVHTKSDSAREAQESVLELLLINHPLDCPICDQGGECPLQDQALRFGPGKSRYTEEKRHFIKPLAISDLVVLDRERCVLCWRCTRFCDEVSGDRFIDLMDRGSLTQINTAHAKPFESYFSGNTIQMCPVGALTSRSYRFLTRPWDLGSSPSTCSHCAVGCSIAIEHRAGEVLRAQSLANDEVNVFWNCDKGRFGHRYASHPERLKTPMILRESKDGPRFEAVHWDSALDLIEAKLQSALSKGGPGSVGLIGGSHATNEDVYAAALFMRDVVGTANLDFRTFDSGFPYDEFGEASHIGSTATFSDLDSAAAILWIGGDPEEELPVLYLRIRKAVERGSKLVVIGPRKLSISDLGIHLQSDAGAEAQVIDALTADASRSSSDAISRAREALSKGKLVVCAGQQFIGYTSPGIPQRVSRLLAARSAKLLLCVPNANSQGCIDMGLHPAAAGGFSGPKTGMSTADMLRAAAAGRIEFLWIMGADVLTDFPDARLAAAALSSSAFVVVSELFPTDTARSADVVLPAASVVEKEGSFTNLERRIQKVNMAVPAPGVARADWQIFGDLAQRMGHDWSWATSRDVANQIARHLPTHADFAWEALGEAPAPIRQAGDDPAAEGAWPFSWELRAVDATRRRGWVWPMNGHADPNGAAGQSVVSQAAGSSPPVEPQAGASREFPLALLAGRMLFDDGAMVSRSPELRNVRKPPFVELHPDEANLRGLNDGEAVRVRSPHGEVQVTLRISSDSAKGAAFVPYELAGFRANALMDSSQPINFVEVAR